ALGRIGGRVADVALAVGVGVGLVGVKIVGAVVVVVGMFVVVLVVVGHHGDRAAGKEVVPSADGLVVLGRVHLDAGDQDLLNADIQNAGIAQALAVDDHLARLALGEDKILAVAVGVAGTLVGQGQGGTGGDGKGGPFPKIARFLTLAVGGTIETVEEAAQGVRIAAAVALRLNVAGGGVDHCVGDRRREKKSGSHEDSAQDFVFHSYLLLVKPRYRFKPNSPFSFAEFHGEWQSLKSSPGNRRGTRSRRRG